MVPGTVAAFTAVSSQAFMAWKFQLRAYLLTYCGEKQAAPPASTLGQSSQALNTMLPIEGLARIKGWGSQYLFEPIETSIGPPATRLTEP